jgi:hypothetical protein
VTLDPELRARVVALAAALPGATISGVMDELLQASLPIFEDVAAAMRGATGAEGLDEAAAQDTLAALIGSRILRAAGLDVQDNRDTSGGGVTTDT